MIKKIHMNEITERDIYCRNITKYNHKVKSVYEQLMRELAMIYDDLDDFCRSARYDEEQFYDSYTAVLSELTTILQRCENDIKPITDLYTRFREYTKHSDINKT